MATTFVYSGATGANNGTSWTNAWTSLASATGAAAGDIVKVHKTHSQTGLTTDITFLNGNTNSPVFIVCVDKDNSDALATGGSLSWSTASRGIGGGNIYVRGLTFIDTGGALVINATSDTDGHCVFELCTFSEQSTTNINIGTPTRLGYRFISCTFDFASATNAACTLNLQAIAAQAEFIDCTIVCRATQTNLISISAGGGGQVSFRGLTCSGTVTNLFAGGTDRGPVGMYFEKCDLPAFTNVWNTAPTNSQGRVEFYLCGTTTISAPVVGPYLLWDHLGTVASSLAKYRSGGANDLVNANAYSWEMITNASAQVFNGHMETTPFTIWCNAGSFTLTVYVASNATLTNEEFWIEVESPSEAGSPTAQGKFRTTRRDVLASAANLTTDGSSTWTGGAPVATKQKISVSIAPAVAGPVTVRYFLAKASQTVYVDPLPEIA